MKYLIILCLIGSNAYSDCPQNVRPIKAGEVAECTGFLFSDNAEKTAAQARDDAKYYQDLSIKLTERSDLQDKESQLLNRRLQNYITETNSLAKENANKETYETLYKFAYFSLGAILTGVIVSNVNR